MSIPDEYFAQMPAIAEAFFAVNGVHHNEAEKRIDFTTPWCITVQALGGTALLTTSTPWQSVFALNLHLQDSHHLAQRHYANHQERTIQAAIYCQDFVKQHREAGGAVFIKSILGPSHEQSVFPFVAHISPIVQLFDATFVIHGAEYDFLDVHGQKVLTFMWNFKVIPMRAQDMGSFLDGKFDACEAQSANPIELMAQHNVRPVARPEPSKEIKKRKAPEPEPDECSVCLENLAGVEQTVVVPCGHTLYCWDCANKLDECALCRTAIEGRFKIFN